MFLHTDICHITSFTQTVQPFTFFITKSCWVVAEECGEDLMAHHLPRVPQARSAAAAASSLSLLARAASTMESIMPSSTSS